jgi:TonB family protein
MSIITLLAAPESRALHAALPETPHHGQNADAAATQTIEFLGAPISVPADTIHLPADQLGAIAISHPLPQYVDPPPGDWPYGEADALLLIASDGSIERVLARTGPEELSASLVQAVQTWRFQPIRDPTGRPAHGVIRVDALFEPLRDNIPSHVEIAALEPGYKSSAKAGAPTPVRPPVSQTPTATATAAPPQPAAGSAHTPLYPAVAATTMERLRIAKVEPVYPAEARQQQMRGTVVLRIVVGRDGRVAQAGVVSGQTVLAKPCLAAVRRWRYRPYRLHGKPVAVETTVVFHVNLAQKTVQHRSR